MELIDKKKFLNYGISFLIFVLFALAIWALSLLISYFNQNSYKNALENFLANNTENYGFNRNFSQGNFNIEEDYSTVSIKAFSLTQGSKRQLFFLVPFFTHNGIDLAVVASDNLSQVQYLGTISQEARESISTIAISLCEEKVKKILELDR